jgi:alpha-L-fucosidase
LLLIFYHFGLLLFQEIYVSVGQMFLHAALFFILLLQRNAASESCPKSDDNCIESRNDKQKKTQTNNIVDENTIPSWDELDNRPIPSWYDEAKLGIFIHWGVFSVPAYRSEWFWRYWEIEKRQDYINFVSQTEKPGFSYTEYASRFSAEFYDPKQWAAIFAQSGAQYVVLTSKHHDGYCLWNSTSIQSTWNWNAIDVGPRRDVLGDLASEIKKTISTFTNKPLRFGLYHSLYEWFNPMYLADKGSSYSTQEFVDRKILPELYELVNKYQPELIWSDGDWEASSEYWKAREFLDWYTRQSSVASTAIYNDRWGYDVTCQHGTFVTCSDRYNPDTLQQHKYENAFTIDSTTWGYSRYSNYSDYMTVEQLIHTIVKTVAFNGNVLINIGPAADGTIHPIFIDRLQGIGMFLFLYNHLLHNTWGTCLCWNVWLFATLLTF